MQSNRNRKSKRWSRKNTTCVNLGIGLAREGNTCKYYGEGHQ